MHRGDHRRVELGEPLQGEVVVVDHPAQHRRQVGTRHPGEQAEVAARREHRPVAAEHHHPHRVVLGQPGGHLGEVLRHRRVDRVAVVGPVEPDGGDAVGDFERERRERRRGRAPAGGVRVLLQRADPPVDDRDQVREARVDGTAAASSPARVPPGDEQAAVVEREEPLGLRDGGEVPTDRAPPVAAHRLGPVVVAADPERHAVGQHALEVRRQQRVERRPVARGQGLVQASGQVGCGVHGPSSRQGMGTEFNMR